MSTEQPIWQLAGEDCSLSKIFPKELVNFQNLWHPAQVVYLLGRFKILPAEVLRGKFHLQVGILMVC